MRHIKKFENIDYLERQKLLSSVCFYFESVISITEEEGFMECLFDDSDGVNKEYFTFYFRPWTDEDVYEKFETFLKGLKIKIKKEKVFTQDVQIDIKISETKIKEFAELYDNIQKYNL